MYPHVALWFLAKTHTEPHFLMRFGHALLMTRMGQRCWSHHVGDSDFGAVWPMVLHETDGYRAMTYIECTYMTEV